MRALAVALWLLVPVSTLAQSTPDAAVDRWRQAHETRDFLLYDALLADDYVFEAASGDVGAIGAFLDRAADLQATQAMFSGQPGSGRQVVQGITVSLTPATSWIEGTVAGSQVRRYLHSATISFLSGDVATITSDQEFQVVGVDLEGETEYRLLVWREFDVAAARTADLTWGRVKFGTGGVPARAWSVGRLKAAHAP